MIFVFSFACIVSALNFSTILGGMKLDSHVYGSWYFLMDFLLENSFIVSGLCHMISTN